jgi:hypothetical protein
VKENYLAYPTRLRACLYAMSIEEFFKAFMNFRKGGQHLKARLTEISHAPEANSGESFHGHPGF